MTKPRRATAIPGLQPSYVRSRGRRSIAALEQYLRTDYQIDKQQLERTLKVIELVLPMFGDDVMVTTEKESFRTWPYRRDGKEIDRDQRGDVRQKRASRL